MKTAEKVAGELAKNIIVNHGWGSKELLIESLKVFEEEIRKDERETRVKELTSRGEFKTVGEASEYCRLHGIGGIGWKSEIFTIAGALMDARKDQDKITRHACAENMAGVENGYTEHAARAAIMNTKAV